MRLTFNEFLEEKFMETYIGTKDNAEGAFDNWLENLDLQEVIDYAEEWGDCII